MILRVKLFGVEAFTAEFEDQQPVPANMHNPDAPVPPTFQEVIEAKAETAIRKLIENPWIGKQIGRISTVWVAAGMKR
ncbi:hypothetical protein A5630_25370 [Mycolicibacterium mucogenicum]|uniref:Uncharacterized protein n=1 Tax=Mycolicibacterium mucogenicum TaxID=56689 RepID=A0A1A3GY68_MYCMU|nr:hypothetical protein [Mycolicibacterium mucogenicum]OBJ40284.1 hypothetical protein A5630_25370 [Mycolicibacterium mucogenicum]